VTQQSGNQFEDDLTMGMDEEESFASDSIDLLGFGGGDQNSPIARLKTIILSIDWEINDDILQQLDDELHDLSEVWENDKIKQVYVQGLSKIGKYIYKEKAGSHPNSIKLLITFYHNLEKIVTNEDSMTEDEKKNLLLADVKKFDQLKSQIGKPVESSEPSRSATITVATEEAAPVSGFSKESADVIELKTLKALVLGIDWEINDLEIQKLGNEVKRLETVFSQNKAKLILLQGIGALSSYINKKRSQSNSGVFPLLHSFYVTLEKISSNDLSAAEEKSLLLAEVAKFNSFKSEISNEKESPASVISDAGSTIDHAESPAAFSGSPASFSGGEPLTEDQKEELPDDTDVAADVTSRLSSVFGDEEQEEGSIYKDSIKNEALEGVNVETEADDDSGEEALPYQDGSVAPALTDIDEDSSFSVEKLAEDLSVAPPTKKVEAIVGHDIEEEEDFILDDAEAPISDVSNGELIEEVADPEETLQGVDVETEADDDSGEEALPMEAGELAPALSGSTDESGFNAENMASEFDKSDTEAIEDRLGSFFDDEVANSSEGWVSETSEELLPEVESTTDNEIVAALSDFKDESSEPEKIYDEKLEQEKIVAEETAEQIFEEVDEDAKAFDNDSAPASFSDSDPDILTEDTAEEDNSDDSAQAFVEDELSFLNDDIDDRPEEILKEEVETESETEQSLAFLDDDISTFDNSDDSVIEDSATGALFETDEDNTELQDVESESSDVSVVEDDSEGDDEAVDENILAFFDDVEESADQQLIEQTDDEIAFEVEAEDVEEDDEIEFTVPGEDLEQDSEKIAETEEKEEDIEFALPGEIAASIGVAAVAAVSDIEFADSAEDENIIEDDEVVFEVVGDDVELDLLPGEAFDDSVEIDEETDFQNTKKEPVEFTVVEEGFDTGRYESLGILVAAVQNNIGDDGIQDLLSEINKLRISKETSYSDKTFLQLLSTITQFVDKNREDTRGLKLMAETVSGLEMSDSSETSEDAVQEKLFTCTSQILLLQTKEITTMVVVPEETSDSEIESEYVEKSNDDDDTEDEATDKDSINYKLVGQEEQLASFVQKELADIRKLFVEEIGSLRKELTDKKP